ncbi:2-nitropropane dioxygenase, partial [bacterium]
AVLIGTAFLRCPEATISDVHRRALAQMADDGTVLTNVFSGRPARGIVNRLVREVGPISKIAPEFPLAGAAIGPLRSASEAASSLDFAQMWAGQAAPLGREMPAGELTRTLAREGLERLGSLSR